MHLYVQSICWYNCHNICPSLVCFLKVLKLAISHRKLIYKISLILIFFLPTKWCLLCELKFCILQFGNSIQKHWGTNMPHYREVSRVRRSSHNRSSVQLSFKLTTSSWNVPKRLPGGRSKLSCTSVSLSSQNKNKHFSSLFKDLILFGWKNRLRAPNIRKILENFRAISMGMVMTQIFFSAFLWGGNPHSLRTSSTFIVIGKTPNLLTLPHLLPSSSKSKSVLTPLYIKDVLHRLISQLGKNNFVSSG